MRSERESGAGWREMREGKRGSSVGIWGVERAVSDGEGVG